MPTIACALPVILGFFFTLNKPIIPKIKPAIIIKTKVKEKTNAINLCCGGL